MNPTSTEIFSANGRRLVVDGTWAGMVNVHVREKASSDNQTSKRLATVPNNTVVCQTGPVEYNGETQWFPIRVISPEEPCDVQGYISKASLRELYVVNGSWDDKIDVRVRSRPKDEDDQGVVGVIPNHSIVQQIAPTERNGETIWVPVKVLGPDKYLNSEIKGLSGYVSSRSLFAY